MSVVIDTGVFYALVDDSTSRHEAATSALSTVFEGEYGQPFVTDYIYDETVTLTLTKTGSHREATKVGRRLRGVGEFPELVRFQHISPSVFDAAVTTFDELHDQQLSFTDASTIAFLRENDIDAVLSFDDDFDGLVDRLGPRDL